MRCPLDLGARFERLLRKLEGQITDHSLLIPHTDQWFDYWLIRLETIRTSALLLPKCLDPLQRFIQLHPVPWFFNNMGSLLSLSRQPPTARQHGF